MENQQKHKKINKTDQQLTYNMNQLKMNAHFNLTLVNPEEIIPLIKRIQLFQWRKFLISQNK